MIKVNYGDHDYVDSDGGESEESVGMINVFQYSHSSPIIFLFCVCPPSVSNYNLRVWQPT